MKNLPSEFWYVATPVAVLIVVLAIIAYSPKDTVVLTPGPCTMLGLAAAATDPDTPLLIVDCEGTQFGVRVVVP